MHADRAAGRSERDDDRARGAAGAGDRDAHAGERHPLLQRREEAVRVGVAADPAAVRHANRVDRADAPRDGVHLVDRVEERHLERNRDARAADADGAGERLEVGGGDGRHRQVDRVEARGAKRRVVDRRRHRVADGAADHAVDLRRCGDGSESVFFEERVGRDLADAADAAAVGPSRSEPRGEDSRREPVRAHADQDHVARRVPRGAEFQERQAIAQRRRRRGDLDHLRAGRAHRVHARGKVDRHAVVVVRREHDAPAGGLCDQIVEMRAPLEVDPLRAFAQRGGKDALALLFRSGEPAAFPGRTAGHDDGPRPAGKRGRGVRVAHRVEPQLDQIGVGDRVPFPAQLGRRLGRHRCTQLRSRHSCQFATRGRGSKKKAPSTTG